jgi:hypothetical protein
MMVYLDLRRWWIGYECGNTHHYVCVIPALVVRWPRRLKRHARRPSGEGV